MTHEELLNKMPLGYWYSQNELNGILRAIRAVVELHKPHDIYFTGEAVPETYCDGCNQEYYTKYPCPTIQAIEKELK